MSQEEVVKVFEPFQRAKESSSLNKAVYSNSYGLSICKNICKQLEGDITVNSHVGWGSAFTFTMKGFITQNVLPQLNKTHYLDNGLLVEYEKDPQTITP